MYATIFCNFSCMISYCDNQSCAHCFYLLIFFSPKEALKDYEKCFN